MTRHALVVCTANVCRSPSVERLLQRGLDGLVDVDGERWRVRSAGLASTGAAVDPHTVAAAAAVGIDLGDHAARLLDPRVLATDGADLVLTMTRAQLRAVVEIDPAAWPRTFTLKELVRRAASRPAPTESVGFAGWVRDVGTTRRPTELMGDDPADDIADPYRRPRRHHEAMIAEVSSLVDQLVRLGRWLPDRGSGAGP